MKKALKIGRQVKSVFEPVKLSEISLFHNEGIGTRAHFF
jgi:hypothetical protein